MNFSKTQEIPGKFTIALFGEKPDFMSKIENTILQGHGTFGKPSPYCELKENDSFRIISAPKFFDDECMNPDQKIIDFMALSYPGPHLFILAIESENTSKEKVGNQINAFKYIFEENVTENLVVILEKQENNDLLSYVDKVFNVKSVILKRMDSVFMNWSSNHQSFQFDYKNYSHKIVQRRKHELEHKRNEFHPYNDPQRTGGSAHSSLDAVFNIVLLGKGGTGKSASANTILAAENSLQSMLPSLTIGNSQQDSTPFKSYPSSTPVTTKCETRMMKVGSGKQIRLVDTPDFFHEDISMQEAQLNECKKYCQPGQCVVLLVIQLGRFTEGERGILENLEKLLGWRIREKTIVLFTHGENTKCNLNEFIVTRSHLKEILEACGNHYHVFKNTSKDSKQVKELIKKVEHLFPNLTEKDPSPQCCLC
ncbi:GTPase IMAP family member 8-like [Oreochromis niloticus]|uniref:GTPase IMAP family member 8-like n=1 Tax=Oreochromis niloticus TaxID=8128 RepID=A0A669E796_ORENI|nr:GTPase IMAP family member 8-like [Oreochromis niloticus]